MKHIKQYKVFESYDMATIIVDDVRDILIDLEDSGIPVIAVSGEAIDYKPTGMEEFTFSSDKNRVHYLPKNNFCVILGNNKLERGWPVDDVEIDTGKYWQQLTRLIEYLKGRGYLLDSFYFEQDGKTVWYNNSGSDNLTKYLLELATTNWIKLGFIKSS